MLHPKGTNVRTLLPQQDAQKLNEQQSVKSKKVFNGFSVCFDLDLGHYFSKVSILRNVNVCNFKRIGHSEEQNTWALDKYYTTFKFFTFQVLVSF